MRTHTHKVSFTLIRTLEKNEIQENVYWYAQMDDRNGLKKLKGNNSVVGSQVSLSVSVQ